MSSAGKRSWPGRHRGVGGEDDFAGNLVGGSVEVQAFFLHAIADRFEHGEAAVALVEVKNAGSDAHGLQGAKAADAEEQLLANAGACIAAVEARGQVEILRRIAGDFGVEQEKIAAADFHSPDLGANGAAAGFNFDRPRVRRFCRWRVPWGAG